MHPFLQGVWDLLRMAPVSRRSNTDDAVGISIRLALLSGSAQGSPAWGPQAQVGSYHLTEHAEPGGRVCLSAGLPLSGGERPGKLAAAQAVGLYNRPTGGSS